MRRHPILASIAATALAVPLLASSPSPITVEGPGVCDGRQITLEEGEALEERTRYFHGVERVGNADGYQEIFDGGPTRLTMTADAPAGASEADSKVMTVRPTGVLGNPGLHRNAYQGYWSTPFLDEPERIVCAEANIWAGTPDGVLAVQFWFDTDNLANPATPFRTITVSGSGDPDLSEYSANLGPVDIEVRDWMTIQLDVSSVGAMAFYDSAAHDSRLDYVVVVETS